VTSGSAQLGPEARRDALAGMAAEPLDVLIIGGGVTGTGAALDAATRGLRVGLVEARDFAAGTSSKSSKLIHGGLRYLEQFDFGLVREALRERSLLLRRLAPHLVRPIPFVYPLRHRYWERFYVGTGILLYDLLGGSRALPGHRHLSEAGTERVFPDLRPDVTVGAIQYWDAQVDDARYVATLARTAALNGALLATSAEVISFLHDGGSGDDGRISGASVRDLETGDEIEVRARAVVGATGIWTDPIQQLAGTEGTFHVRMSKGIHLVVRGEKIDSQTGMILRTEKSVLFLIPWKGDWIIGTTDTDWELERAHPAPSQADIDYVLGHINAVIRQPLAQTDIEAVYAGLRPLVSAAKASTARLSREHAVAEPVPGLVMIAGGKFTTYRVMGRDVIDAAARSMGSEVGKDGGIARSATAWTPLYGADGWFATWNRRRRIAEETGLPPARVDHLLNRYGTATHELLDLIEARPELGEPIPGGGDYLAVEALYAASHEGALHLEDVLERRTRIAIEVADRGRAAAEPVARLMAEVLGWDVARIGEELKQYRSVVDARLAAEQQPDDAAANAARLQAEEIRPVVPVAELKAKGPGSATRGSGGARGRSAAGASVSRAASAASGGTSRGARAKSDPTTPPRGSRSAARRGDGSR
jgi:glycerol-3-phosphate dehydrogenase